MPKKVKIFFVEDFALFRDAVKLSIHSHSEYHVVLEAGSLPEALQKIKEAKWLGVNFAICDSDLGGGWDQGALIAEALRREVPEIKIVSYSRAEELPKWGDVNVSKERSPGYLLNIIRQLMQQTEEGNP